MSRSRAGASSERADFSLYLASGSPRRAELLASIGVRYRVVPQNVDESRRHAEAPRDYVRRLAAAKAQALRNDVADERPILSADTAVVLDGEIFGKPRDAAHCREMLARLSDRWHEVLTGVAVVAGAIEEQFVVATRVRFKRLSDTEVAAYWHSGEPEDKAGAYAIQGRGGAFVKEIAGSYSNVVGLPLCEVLEVLDRLRVPHALCDPGLQDRNHQ